jgi:hypothetical protein
MWVNNTARADGRAQCQVIVGRWSTAPQAIST